MPQLDRRADLSAIQLVYPTIGRRELLDLYLEVYKLHWLPGSPPGEPAILQEILSTISDPTSEEEQSASTQRSSSHKTSAHLKTDTLVSKGGEHWTGL